MPGLHCCGDSENAEYANSTNIEALRAKANPLHTWREMENLVDSVWSVNYLGTSRQIYINCFF
jgi:hypothetical protein